MSDIEVIFFAVVAVFFGYKLWTAFGKTSGDEKARASESAAYVEKLRAAAQGAKTEQKTVLLNPAQGPEKEEEIPAALRTGVDRAKVIDPTFSLKKFKDGATQAFELVIESFSGKKRDALQFLLSKDVYENFNNILTQREKEDLDATTKVVAVDDAEILDIEMKDNSICHIVVKFVSEQIHFIKNKAGEIIDGSKSQIDRVTDIWTFEKNLSSKKTNWTIVGVQSA